MTCFYSYLESLGARIPLKPEAAKEEEGKCPMKEDTPAPPEPEGIIYLFYFFIGIILTEKDSKKLIIIFSFI